MIHTGAILGTGRGGVHVHQPATIEPAPYADDAFTKAAAVFHAAGDPERLRTLAELARGERCVSELAATFGVGMSTVSQRLRVLRAEHLVDRRREGKHVYYRLADGHVAELIGNALEHASEPNRHDQDTNGEEPR